MKGGRGIGKKENPEGKQKENKRRRKEQSPQTPRTTAHVESEQKRGRMNGEDAERRNVERNFLIQNIGH